MNPIRVLQVLTAMNRGGAETMIMNYYRSMDKSKVQFDFLLHRPEKGAYDDEILEMGGKIYRMPPIHPKNYFKYKALLNQFFEEHKEFHVIHSHLNALSFIVLSAAKKKGINTRIAHSHNAIEPTKIKNFFDKDHEHKALVKNYIFSILRKRVGKKATHFFACGEKAGIWLFGKNTAKGFHILHNAIDTSKFTLSNQFNSLRESENLMGKKIIGHIGRFHPQKNHLFLIDIFFELTKINPHVALCLVGDGDQKKKIEQKVFDLGLVDKVLFLGIRKDIPSILNAFDLFLLPSLYEGLPVTLVEAQSAGVPIIASNTISKEVAITDLITFCSLDQSPMEWAKMVDDRLDEPKKNTLEQIKNAGYDISENAKFLQNFYLEKHY